MRSLASATSGCFPPHFARDLYLFIYIYLAVPSCWLVLWTQKYESPTEFLYPQKLPRSGNFPSFSFFSRMFDVFVFWLCLWRNIRTMLTKMSQEKYFWKSGCNSQKRNTVRENGKILQKRSKYSQNSSCLKIRGCSNLKFLHYIYYIIYYIYYITFYILQYRVNFGNVLLIFQGFFRVFFISGFFFHDKILISKIFNL